MKNDIRVFLYSDFPSPSLDINRISEVLGEYGFSIEVRGNLVNFLSLSDKDMHRVARDFSSAIVGDISSPLDNLNQAYQIDMNSELNKLIGRRETIETLYDGYWIQRTLYRLFSYKLREELNASTIHIIFTSRLFGTFEDRRYHARVILMGQPSLISTTGLVEAPAKPREYYYVRGRMIQSGHDVSGLDEMYKGRFVEYDDPKITPILVSYALQAIFYEIFGTAFCDNPECCLTNSHWQEEVLKVQYQGVLCGDCRFRLEQ